jgi:hypothetical protein
MLLKKNAALCGTIFMNNLTKKLEVCTNIAIIVVAILLSAVLIKKYILDDRTPIIPSNKTSLVGTKLSLSSIDFSQANRTILLALNTGCVFCTASAPFYQKLTQSASNSPIKLIAIMPQDIDTSTKYLNDLHVSPHQIVQIPLGTIGVTGTPTILVVDKSGLVLKAWRGKLTSTQESEVLNLINADATKNI